METSITEQLTTAISSVNAQYEGDLQIKKFEEASKEFNKLVNLGIAQKRGYRLLTLTDSSWHLSVFNINEYGKKDLIGDGFILNPSIQNSDTCISI